MTPWQLSPLLSEVCLPAWSVCFSMWGTQCRQSGSVEDGGSSYLPAQQVGRISPRGVGVEMPAWARSITPAHLCPPSWREQLRKGALPFSTKESLPEASLSWSHAGHPSRGLRRQRGQGGHGRLNLRGSLPRPEGTSRRHR